MIEIRFVDDLSFFGAPEDPSSTLLIAPLSVIPPKGSTVVLPKLGDFVVTQVVYHVIPPPVSPYANGMIRATDPPPPASHVRVHLSRL